jgi:hypothetical protein
MTNEHRTTPEEEAYRRLLNEKWKTFSEAARTVVSEARSAAYGACMIYNYGFQWPQEHDEAMERMSIAAANLADHEHQLLAKIWRAALAAAASVDADDFESIAGIRVYAGDLHSYYRMVSGMIERTLQKKKIEEARRELAEREPIDYTDLPFYFAGQGGRGGC